MGDDFIEVKDFAKSKFQKVQFFNQSQVETIKRNLYTLRDIKDFYNF